ncbi:CBS domain-containing protein [Nocardioides panaciterrulae]|uniref:CBS domain-containing protein n=1 Tax=Nocardioides panaciterrulae TaxID=661492 RepID=A0A7Y9E8F7_9ACTN|nr:CBS domain-containing protein [Nocardioides panaciterrulae]NYD43038.1 CBS domain-containing protein [Nocardioides panaciterrulae]
MLVHELMTSPAVTVAPEVSAKAALRLLAEHGITAMPVVDAAGALVGVVSEADLIRGAVPPDPRAHEIPVPVTSGPSPHRVADLMSHVPLSVRADADLTVAVELMSGTAVKSLPVLRDGVVVGVVSRRDVVAVLARSDARIAAEVEDLVRAAGLACAVQVEEGVVVLDGLDDARDQDLARVLASTVRGVLGVRFGRPSPA